METGAEPFDWRAASDTQMSNLREFKNELNDFFMSLFMY